MTRRTRLAGYALITGSAMLFTFWYSSVRDTESPIDLPWQAQVAFHGVANLLIITGLVLTVSRLTLTGWPRVLWQVGAGLVSVGLFVNYAMMVTGLILVGFAELGPGRRRVVGSALITGSLCWIAVWASGARFDSEDSLPLTSNGIILSTAGLVLICVGLAALGFGLLRASARQLIPAGVAQA